MLRAAIPVALVVAVAGIVLAVGGSIDADDAQCGPGFSSEGARCRVRGSSCPLPLVKTAHGCDAPPTRIDIPETTILASSSDWEAEGRIAPRSIHVAAFSLDAFEATVGAFFCPQCPYPDEKRYVAGDLARAASAMTRNEAAHFCTLRGGRLPTEDEWIVAAAGNPPRRYPWGDTGAVCRRAAWGLATGPCSKKGDGPDTVGSHPEGATSLGVHDMAGNVAEWVDTADRDASRGVARGGSWKTSLATDLRSWSRLEIGSAVKDPRLGVRCAYSGAARD